MIQPLEQKYNAPAVLYQDVVLVSKCSSGEKQGDYSNLSGMAALLQLSFFAAIKEESLVGHVRILRFAQNDKA